MAGGWLGRGLRVCRLAVVCLLTVRILRHGFGGVRAGRDVDSTRLDLTHLGLRERLLSRAV